MAGRKKKSLTKGRGAGRDSEDRKKTNATESAIETSECLLVRGEKSKYKLKKKRVGEGKVQRRMGPSLNRRQ